MKKKILVIEDETIFCRLISRWLENNGYTVFTTLDGEAGLKKIEEEKPDLVLIDTLLPGLDGLQVCREIRSMRLFSNIPIILMSAIYKDIQFVLQAKKIADDFIEKPFKEMELIMKINSLLMPEDKIIPPSPSYKVSMEAEKSKKISDKMESQLSIEVNKNFFLENDETEKHEKQERTKSEMESSREFHIDLPDIENNLVEESKDQISDSDKRQSLTPNQKKSHSIDLIQKELDDLFKMTKKK